LGALGKFTIDLKEAMQGGTNGTQLHIEFHHNAFQGRVGSQGYAQPLADETACLAKVLSTNDPVANPRGLPLPSAATTIGVNLPDANPVRVLLRDPLY
jgi:hypothetical protein